jgi:hypothetical protein
MAHGRDTGHTDGRIVVVTTRYDVSGVSLQVASVFPQER